MDMFEPLRRVEPETSNRIMRRYLWLVWLYLQNSSEQSTPDISLDIPLANLRRVLDVLQHDVFTGEDGAWQDIEPAIRRAFNEAYGPENQAATITALLDDLVTAKKTSALSPERKAQLLDFLHRFRTNIPEPNQ